ncbi:methyltransferase domain-containing protein [Parasphingopyxis sp. CP4]|uniref:class I SAM-dependent methyltransferase n=1 Tax=Parasphingopyxis sp. CP4 TaxID=2724527 RepID=UPI0015A1FBC5|nr:methyltransferase domain-containing protein [Parasphingopyxis sp. CP4]QLC20873.1 methyltransferase domain-containing protein [Parasphingopyxis sp. CP4]
MTEQSNADQIRAHEHEAWQGAAPLYSDYIAPFTAFSGQIALHDEMAPIGAGQKILDVGSGTGDIAVQLRDRGAQVTGIDFAAEMVAIATERHQDIEFLEADVEELPFEDDSFDRAIVNYTAHHFARPEKAFAELRRCLKSGAPLTIVHPIQTEQPSWGSFALSLAEAVPSDPPIGGPLLMTDDPQAYVTFLAAAGFHAPHGEKRTKQTTMDTLDPIIKGGWAVGMLDQQTDAVQQQVLDGINDRAAPYRIEDGSYAFPDNVLIAHATA